MNDYEYFEYMSHAIANPKGRGEELGLMPSDDIDYTPSASHRPTQRQLEAYEKLQAKTLATDSHFTYEELATLELEGCTTPQEVLWFAGSVADIPHFARIEGREDLVPLMHIFRDTAKRNKVPLPRLLAYWKNCENSDMRSLKVRLNDLQYAIHGHAMSSTHIRRYHTAIQSLDLQLRHALEMDVVKATVSLADLSTAMRYSFLALREAQGLRERLIASIEDVCELLQVSERFARKRLKTLSTQGYITVLGGKGRNANYAISVLEID
ncbi:hypothetical protein BCU93_13545 [Vibrio breoganii]|uniref:hypothetical protein n=1 Tax=Vibrio breoganii TaxID=553239 RepID=UPI000C85F818|nr:hypothetical protein [Vibrio breoganii]PMG38566.1 hypothetical protein BCU93_13545 [Vibrio breoganii]